MLVGNERSYILTRKIIFLDMCELSLLNIKKLTLYKVFIECISMQTKSPRFLLSDIKKLKHFTILQNVLFSKRL